MLRCTVNNSNREYSGWFKFFVVDGWFFLGTELIFLALCFLFSLVSATSSYADDIAYIKI
jgi:hypothetical protein